MKTDNTKRIVLYLHRTGKNLITAIIFLAVSVLSFILFIRPVDIGTFKVYHVGVLVAAVLFLLLGVGLIITEPATRKGVKTIVNQYDQSQLTCDFDGARAYFKDNLRVGRVYIYSHEAEQIIPILNIKKIAISRTSANTLCVFASTVYGSKEKLYTFEEEKYDDVLRETQMLTNELLVVNNAIEFQQI